MRPRPLGTSRDYDVVFAGGGLASSLAALAIRQKTPRRRVAIIEGGAQLGGNHTWCFHALDCPAQAERFVAPLVVTRWSGYDVRFPRRVRRIDAPYACITSERLHEAVSRQASPELCLRLGETVAQVDEHRVVLESGEEITAELVVDARGPAQRALPAGGYQKFVGLELEVAPGHPLQRPMLIDATVPQRDGFRFMYALPLSPERVLVEDTYYADDARLDVAAIEADILDYARAHGLVVRRVGRLEQGALPLPFEAKPLSLTASPLRAGYGGGLFHPVTGYSFPLAARFALALAASDPTDLKHSPLAAFSADFARRREFYFALTRSMFRWFPPAERYGVLEHFYRLPEPLIARFYAAELSFVDRARMFIGAPPRGMSLLHGTRRTAFEGVSS